MCTAVSFSKCLQSRDTLLVCSSICGTTSQNCDCCYGLTPFGLWNILTPCLWSALVWWCLGGPSFANTRMIEFTQSFRSCRHALAACGHCLWLCSRPSEDPEFWKSVLAIRDYLQLLQLTIKCLIRSVVRSIVIARGWLCQGVHGSAGMVRTLALNWSWVCVDKWGA